MDKSEEKITSLIVKHIDGLLGGSSSPSVPEELAGNGEFVALHNRLMELRLIISDFAKGNLSHSIKMRGFVAGGLKALQSNLRHLTWQAQQVERGDFKQEVHFLGDFSVAFNSMVAQLDRTMKELRQNEEALTVLTDSLQKEITLRTAAANALKKSEARFKYLAEHDALTNTLNRRSFHAMILSELNNAHENDTTCCVALLDVDHFKTFNDTYGHTEGDIALQHIVAVAQGHLRQTDMLGRYGGEEFIFFFGKADLDQGMAVADRIRLAIENTPVKLSNGTQIPISASIGVAVIKPEWYDAENANKFLQFHIANADNALYKAKQAGRNAVEPAPVIEPTLTQEILNA
ncbi:GGDEF domain-containing protein [Oxalobacter vibrioformis]|uniref:diguanylate cyclase n=1 Tax=Oxalobacter vibrioformis TaxID=933080 RepID=A0A9E9LXH0_9BURK|nr:GGDEF domain-containing protein [Oxalobacter vibrioformis]WAW10502.1 GGDEF domain-containing protein [Oxalobacter vibrioformis]